MLRPPGEQLRQCGHNGLKPTPRMWQGAPALRQRRIVAGSTSQKSGSIRAGGVRLCGFNNWFFVSYRHALGIRRHACILAIKKWTSKGYADECPHMPASLRRHNLARLREELSISQTTLAAWIGRSWSAIKAIETGKLGLLRPGWRLFQD